MKSKNLKRLLSRETSAFISLFFGFFNLFVAGGFFDSLFWHYLDTGLGVIGNYFFIMGMILGMPLGKYGLSSKYGNFAAAGFLMTFGALVWLFWSAWQIRDFHIYG